MLVNASVNKGIILAGGSGTRLFPITRPINKHLLPVYDKPMIYYPLTTLIKSGITEVLIITREIDLPFYQALLGNGKWLGINIIYEIQNFPGGLPEAFIIGESFIGSDNVCLILGDNIILDHQFDFTSFSSGCSIFGIMVQDPSPFGVLRFDARGELFEVEEKPFQKRSRVCCAGNLSIWP
ncbi:sugar phosphate nucleotidyltransferase [Paracoccaceae bacterium]|nr:sugar phosphate nucleotidyltransferase [Paracoccaceae bacterium]